MSGKFVANNSGIANRGGRHCPLEDVYKERLVNVWAVHKISRISIDGRVPNVSRKLSLGMAVE